MNQTRNISVKASVLDSVKTHMTVQQESNRFHYSHAVWQLARMGTYNEAGELPAALRLEGSGDFTELYAREDRLICPVDTSDSELVSSDAFLDALTRCVVYLARSRRGDLVTFHMKLSSKAAENVASSLKEWEQTDVLKAALTEKIQKVQAAGFIKEGQDISALIDTVFERLTVEHLRKRHGRLGEEALWGRELDAVKVLQDAGIDGSDLSNALANLVIHASGQYVDRNKAGIVFNRKDAILMIRDYQRRARIQRPGVRAVDAMLIKQDSTSLQFAPRCPGWSFSLSEKMIKRDVLDDATRWARLAALKSGRGLLPVFFFNGADGSGRSIMLRQVAWELYKDGFATAEITDLDEAAGEAEALATAAVALDAPLILIWDDWQGPGLDPVHAIKELAEAQLSGVPMMILAAAPDVGYNPKKIRQISRTSFEEFTIHQMEEKDLKKVTEETPDTKLAKADVSDSADEEEMVIETIIEMPDDSEDATVEIVQDQKTDQLTVTVTTSDEDAPEAGVLEYVITHRLDTTVEKFASDMNRSAEQLAGDGLPVFNLIRCFGAMGLPVSQRLAEKLYGEKIVKAFIDAVDKSDKTVFNSISDKNDTWWDCGHAIIVRSMVESSTISTEQICDILNSALEKLMEDIELQPLAARLIRSVHNSQFIASSTITTLTKTLTDLLGNESLAVSPVFLSDLFLLSSAAGEQTDFQTAVINALASYARKNNVDSFVAVTPLLRNRVGQIDDAETLEILKAAKPDCDRMAFRFLLKFLSDHLPNDLRETAVDNARTAAAREPDGGFAVAAYLRLCWARGTEEQIARSIEEIKSWLAATPDDRIVRREFLEYVIAQGSEELKREMIEPVQDWLRDHMDEGPVRNSLIELSYSLNDPAISDRVISEIANWIERLGNNRLVRQNYFRRAERRNDKGIMRRACQVGVSWLNTHPDDRETVRSLIYLASRVGDPRCTVPALSSIHRWLSSHIVERDILRRYLILADRTGRGRAITHAVEAGLDWIQKNPDDSELREILLGLAARRVDKKAQIKVYDVNAHWLESLETPDAMTEYLVGRLGVRAGIARRAIPLLERAAVRDESELKNHARLWLGSAYRVAEAYDAAIKVWEEVKESDDSEMAERAVRNLDSLNEFLKEKFPQGYPPPEPKPRKRPQRSNDDGEGRTHRRQDDGQDNRGRRPRRDFRDGDGRKRDGGTPHRRKGGQKRQPAGAMGGSSRGATLGDLFKLKGLNLNDLTGKSDKNKGKNKKDKK